MTDGRVLYSEIVPYETPSSLDVLKGPDAGCLELPVTVHWGPQHRYDLSNADETVFAYQQLVREGTPAVQEELLNAEVLRRVWPELVLPERCRTVWEERFPELAA